MYDKTQLMRGSLEGCILKIIEQHMTYGYEILMNMKEAGWIDVTEGTLYPILLRLEKLHYIRAEKGILHWDPGANIIRSQQKAACIFGIFIRNGVSWQKRSTSCLKEV